MEVRKTLRKAEDTQYCAFSDEAKPVGIEKGIWIIRPTEVDEDDKSKESALPQVGDKTSKRKVEMMNAKFFLRRATRKHGEDYESAAAMLMEMHSLEAMPEEMRKEIKDELAEVTAVILTEKPTKELGSFEGEKDTLATQQKPDPRGDIKPVMNMNFEENKMGHVSMKTREMAGSAIERVAGKNARTKYDTLMISQLKKSAKELPPKGKYCEPQLAVIAAAAVKHLCPITSSAFPELFDLSYEWIYDSGASRHFCGQGNAKKFINMIKKGKSHFCSNSGRYMRSKQRDHYAN